MTFSNSCCYLLRFFCLLPKGVLITHVFLLESSVLLPDILMLTYRLTDMRWWRVKDSRNCGGGDEQSWIVALFCRGGQGQTTQTPEVTLKTWALVPGTTGSHSRVFSRDWHNHNFYLKRSFWLSMKNGCVEKSKVLNDLENCLERQKKKKKKWDEAGLSLQKFLLKRF